MMPALQIITFSRSLLERKVSAALRTLDSELVSISSSETRPGSRKEEQASWPLERLRTPRKRVAPVAERARAVSMPMPEEQPVIRIV